MKLKKVFFILSAMSFLISQPILAGDEVPISRDGEQTSGILNKINEGYIDIKRLKEGASSFREILNLNDRQYDEFSAASKSSLISTYIVRLQPDGSSQFQVITQYYMGNLTQKLLDEYKWDKADIAKVEEKIQEINIMSSRDAI